MTSNKDQLTVDQMYSLRREAEEAGHRYYFTGKPCPKGHLVPRYVSNYLCVECVRILNEKHRALKPQIEKQPRISLSEEKAMAKRRVYKQKYWIENKERLSKKHKEWLKKNKEKEKERDRKRYRKNPEPFIEKAKKYYWENREEMLKKKREYREKNKAKIQEQNRLYYLKKKQEKENS